MLIKNKNYATLDFNQLSLTVKNIDKFHTIKINEQINSGQVRVIDENGTNLGVLSISQALALAHQKGLDLVEITDKTDPPVVKIISYDKYRYQKEKELKKQQHQRGGVLKQVRITPRSALNDLKIRAKKINEFLAQGNKVEIALVLKGREKANREWANKKIEEFLSLIETNYKITVPPKFGGIGIVMQITKK